MAVEAWGMVAPTSMSLSGACVSDPTWSTNWKAGQLGHLDWFETGLVATYPKSHSQSCGKRIDRVPKRMAWSIPCCGWWIGRADMWRRR